MKTPVLDNRLTAIADCVNSGGIVADVGCDHGYLAAHLVLCGQVKLVYASDINKKPLNSAKKTVDSFNLNDNVLLFQSDGLKDVPRDVTTIVIAGMGGELIMKILDEADWICRKGMQLVLQPMSFLPELRTFLYSRGFEIKNEVPIIDHPRYYLIIDAFYTGKKKELSDKESLLGLLEFSSKPEAELYLSREYKKYKKMADGLSQAKGEDEKYKLCLKKLEYLKRWNGED